MSARKTERMLIGELADAAGVGVETLRFYEREGLLPEPPRSAAGYRLYDSEAASRVGFVLRAKELGFTLSETRELLQLRVTDESGCEEVEAAAREKIADIERRLDELGGIKAALEELVRSCAASEPTGDCPILDALESAESDGG